MDGLALSKLCEQFRAKPPPEFSISEWENIREAAELFDDGESANVAPTVDVDKPVARDLVLVSKSVAPVDQPVPSPAPLPGFKKPGAMPVWTGKRRFGPAPRFPFRPFIKKPGPKTQGRRGA